MHPMHHREPTTHRFELEAVKHICHIHTDFWVHHKVWNIGTRLTGSNMKAGLMNEQCQDFFEFSELFVAQTHQQTFLNQLYSVCV
jgi:hypothetical protein